MIDKIYKFWNIKPEHIFSDEFTGYEDLYEEFDKHTKETYEAEYVRQREIKKMWDILKSDE